ncbi:MAG: sugar ABC transporter permease [Firmicutes bacterium]|nr:sugar ABC transporter permease [Bacillota bacterium]
MSSKNALPRLLSPAAPLLWRNLEVSSFILPTVVLFTLFVLYPSVYLVYASFFKWSGVGDMHFVGLRNYIQVFAND